MPVEMGIWRIDGDAPRRLTANVLPSEAELEAFLERDPSLLGERLLIIGRQVHTPHGKFIDLLGIDADGNLHVLELKRDRTPRDVVAQVLDYGAWVTTLDREQVIELANAHLDVPFETAFDETFGSSAPDEINSELRMLIVATDLDPGSERIVNYLREFGVPVNAAFFTYLEDDSRRYLARSWLASEEDATSAGSSARGRRGKTAEWNGTDWFISFGHEPGGGRRWEDALRYGFVSAGGGEWYSRSLHTVPVGARVNVHIPGTGYVAVGETTGSAAPVEELLLEVDGGDRPFTQLDLVGSYENGAQAVAEGRGEHALPVRWLDARPLAEAYWEKGMFANQNSACKLRQEFTLGRLAVHFDV